jgi:hypothetical protein
MSSKWVCVVAASSILIGSNVGAAFECTGTKNATTLNNCINTAAQSSSSDHTVLVSGSWDLRDAGGQPIQVIVKPGVAVVGAGTRWGTTFNVHYGQYGSANDYDNAAIYLMRGSRLEGITFWYPNQSITASAMTSYSPTVALLEDQAFEEPNGVLIHNNLFMNSYAAIFLGSHRTWTTSGMGPHERAVVSNNRFGICYRGIIVDCNTDIDRFLMNHFHPQLLKYNAGGSEGGASQAMKNWLKANEVAMEVRRSDGPLVEGLYVSGALYGVWLTQGSTGGVHSPQIVQSGFNSCSKGVYSNEASQAPAELSVTENNFGGCGTAVYLKGVGRVTISNNVFWNSAAHHVELVSPLHFDVDGNTASVWGNNYSFLKVSGTGSKFGSVSGNAGSKVTGAIPAAIDVANSTRVVVVANTFEISSSYPVVRFQSTTSNSIAGANRGGSGVQNLGTGNSVWP